MYTRQIAYGRVKVLHEKAFELNGGAHMENILHVNDSPLELSNGGHLLLEAVD